MAVAQDFGDPLQSDLNGLIVPKTKLKYSGYECFIASIICLAFGCDAGIAPSIGGAVQATKPLSKATAIEGARLPLETWVMTNQQQRYWLDK